MLTLDEAREWLRIDGTANDFIISGLLEAVPSYIETATDLTPEEQERHPLCKTVAKFLLHLWYDAEQTESEKLQNAIDNLLSNIRLSKIAKG